MHRHAAAMSSIFDLRSSILDLRLHQSWQRLQEPDEQPRGALQLIDADPFVRGVRLGDVSGSKHDTRNPAVSQHAGVAEIIDADWPGLSGDLEEVLDKWGAPARGQRVTGNDFEVAQAGGEIVFPEKALDLAPHAGVGFAGNGAAIHGDDAVVGHEVGLPPACDGAAVDG